MFEQFYGFAKTSFGRDLEPSELFQTGQHKETLARMRYTVERRQFALFTGEVGADKSTAARLLTDSLHPARYLVLHITDSDFTPRNFYYEALHQLGHLPRSIFIGRKPPLRKMFILNQVGIQRILERQVPGIGSAIRTAIFFYLSTEGLKAVPENVVAIDPPVQDKLKAVLRGPGAEGGTADRMAGKSTSVPSLEKGKLSFGFS